MDAIESNETEINIVAAKTAPKTYIQKIITAAAGDATQLDEPFYVFDVGKVVDQYERWVAALPNVQPFYAVKCNSDIVLLKTLAALGTGFDCASKNEIDAVLGLGVSPCRIVYANTYKNPSFLTYAKMKHVDLMTFDSADELDKVKQHFPLARLVLRLKSEGSKALMGEKFGCSVAEGKQLLQRAKELGLDVIGISFHVGLNCQTPRAYEISLKHSAELFVYASSVGLNFKLLNIGGGFTTTMLFETIVTNVKFAIKTYFSGFPHLKVIAEPGSFFASSTHALAVCVIGKRIRDANIYMYFLSDGIFGSFFNSHLRNHAPPLSMLNEDPLLSLHESIIWGPCCAPPDKLCVMHLPELFIGDWLVCEEFGAYTRSMASTFNGFPLPPVHYYVTEKKSDRLRDLLSARKKVTSHTCQLIIEK